MTEEKAADIADQHLAKQKTKHRGRLGTGHVELTSQRAEKGEELVWSFLYRLDLDGFDPDAFFVYVYDEDGEVEIPPVI